MDRNTINEIVSDYSDDITIGVLGSHSALEIGHGAKQEGFKTLVVCEKGREKTYTQHYNNLFDEVLLVDNFKDMINPENQEKMRQENTIFIPNRSFSVYVGYDNIEDELKIPLLGSRNMLRTEERDIEGNQYDLLDAAGITKPKMFDSPDEIDRTVIVKVPEKERTIERAFFYANSPEEYREKADERIEKGIISEEALKDATIEEYVKGAKFNANYFWSPVSKELDLLGFDRRIQTDLDGVLDLPADEQLELGASPQNVEIGHMGATMRESQIEMIFEEGMKFVEACRKEYPPGIIGLFALQGAVTKDLEFYVFDVSPRIPGCPCVEPTSPYMKYKYMKEVGPGRRVAMEIDKAVEDNELQKITT
ncbi:formate--phosphoribosylaminoimidazolecarboxamide ligase family protein [Methanonatronarchaeum sp. AMET6-2]|uniref:formate--phosphoribosylaminoimidazolecarboxamide ligase family protein n=1 Tax=Methanonatronarchaeum sp. AMET6-2 TaxID=2933293 RepID=UPI00121FD7D4|nr:formate--phosphoribosylaminoimidazolecarboxamide ligase family protein [Methanonatronarchaeum sp. AMET6-2]RZN63467.1 MAG: formate--phosphoribosylaminoimidazolecarboxamide ligase family protein [Methanonatronarchaeia archaeon]UOY09753.1 formate--phosphoribosylaminoimidazolecarboxamide ligase family protein [Methanonatronarchaeum sp. AMET6-2]